MTPSASQRPRYDLSRIVVIDLEATCWEGPSPPGETSEIIEVGSAVLHVADLRVERGPEILVRPTRSRVGDFCTQLTGITQALLDERGRAFADAIEALREAHGDLQRTVWASYGDYDRRKLTDDCRLQGVPFPLSESHLNVKRLLALAAGWPREEGMAGALRRLGIELVPGTRLHRGTDDAVHIAEMLGRVLASGLRGLTPTPAP
jgi:inhibitor of KinA sporulation pathway (predicted exonuclease)